MADHAANIALDRETEWSIGAVDLGNCRRIRLATDGVVRGDGSASAGLAILSYDAGEKLLYRAGKLLGTQSSSFVAELLALEWGLHVLMDSLNIS